MVNSIFYTLCKKITSLTLITLALFFLATIVYAATSTQTSNTDFDAGTYSQTQVSGTGSSANIILSSENADTITTMSSTIPYGGWEQSCVSNSSTGKIYCFGGYDNNLSDATDKIIEYDPSNDTITTKNATLPTARFYLSCAENSATNKIYCFGGSGGSYLNQIVEYDPSATDNSASAIRIMTSTLPSGRDELSCAENSLTNKIYCFGGYYFSGGDTYLSQIIEFDPASDQLTTKTTTLPSARRALSCEEDSTSGKIYCFGGKTSTARLNQIVEFNFNTGVNDNNTDARAIKSNLPANVQYNSCTQSSANNKIYCFGGDNGGEIDDIVEYTPSSDQAVVKSTALPSARFEHSCAESPGIKRIYCFGGYDSNSSGWINSIVQYNSTAQNYYSGNFTSSAIDTGASNDFTTLDFTITEPAGTDVKFQLRTATTQGGLSSATWYGPTGTSDYYTTTGQTINSTIDNKQWIQYKTFFTTSDVSQTGTFSDITINYGTEEADPTPTPTPTPATTTTSSSSSTTGGSVAGVSTACGETTPLAPELFQIATTSNSATLYFTQPAINSGTYFISYGFNDSANQFGTSFVNNSYAWVLNYTINLSPNTNYYFKVRATNGCAAGDWSKVVMAKTQFLNSKDSSYFEPNRQDESLPIETPAPQAEEKSLETQKIVAISSNSQKPFRLPNIEIAEKVVQIAAILAATIIIIPKTLYTAFSNFYLIKDIPLVLLRFFFFLLQILGIKKKSKPWGIVYDSITKQPIDPALVTLYKLGKDQSIENAKSEIRITDFEGRFGFLVTKGKYVIQVKKEDYSFPSKRLMGKTEDNERKNLYFGDILEINDPTLIDVSIPMDPVSYNWNQANKPIQYHPTPLVFRDEFVNLVNILGLILSFVIYILSSTLLNLSLLLIYITLFILRNFLIKPKKWGRIFDILTQTVLPFTTVKVIRENGMQEGSCLTDHLGRYYLILQEGTHYLQVEKVQNAQVKVLKKYGPLTVSKNNAAIGPDIGV